MGKKRKKYEKSPLWSKFWGVQKENNNISARNTLVSSRHITKTSKSKTDKRKRGAKPMVQHPEVYEKKISLYQSS